MENRPDVQDMTLEDLKQEMKQPLDTDNETELKRRVEICSTLLQGAKDEIAKEVWGQEEIVDLTLTGMVAGGNLLAEGVPGLAKTRLCSRLARVMGLDFKRVQCTPDLMPPDILGSEIIHADPDTGKRKFEFVPGPVFTQFLMADEINRTGPRTQSALLEAMQEQRVTVAGNRYALDRPFFVMATQNPLEQEGTYPLPEAQLDRFMMKINFDYPDRETEKKIALLNSRTSEDIRELFSRHANGDDLTKVDDHDSESKLRTIIEPSELIIMQAFAKTLPLPDTVNEAIAKIVRRLRPRDESAFDSVKDSVDCGPSPRTYEAFAKLAKARAFMDGRTSPDVTDVLAVAKPVLNHRVILNHGASAMEGVTVDSLVEEVTADLRMAKQPKRRGPSLG